MEKLKHIYLLLLILAFPGFTTEQDVYVFLPSTVRARVLQEKLTTTAPSLRVTVFGQYKEFAARVKTTSPAAILTKPEIVDQVTGYSKSLTGLRRGSAEESMIIVSVNEKIDLSTLPSKVLGVIDYLGRDGMTKFFSILFNPPPRFKSVTKIEDLLALLSFGIADGILVTPQQADYLSTISKLSFNRVTLPAAKTGIASLAIREGTRVEPILNVIKALPPETIELIGVEQWR